MVRRFALACALVVASSGCAADEAEPRARQTPSATTSQVDAPLPCVPGAEPFTGEAADELGAERVMDAYCLLAELVARQELTSLALPVPEQDARDLLGLRRHLSPSARRDWEQLVRARAGGDPRATARVDGLTLHDVRRVPAGYQRADDGPYVFGTRVGPAVADLEGDALRLTFTVDTGLVLEEKGDDTGRHSLLPVSRKGTYVLVPDGDRWLVERWDVSFEHGDVRLVTG